MASDPTAPISERPGGIWLQRAVGFAAMVAGIALAWLFAYLNYRIALQESESQTKLVVLLVSLAAISGFLLSSGFRMLLNRPNAYGSLFSPATWFAIAAAFFVGGAFMAAKLLESGAPLIALEPALYSFFFGTLSAWAGWHARRKARKSTRSEA